MVDKIKYNPNIRNILVLQNLFDFDEVDDYSGGIRSESTMTFGHFSGDIRPDRYNTKNEESERLYREGFISLKGAFPWT